MNKRSFIFNSLAPLKAFSLVELSIVLVILGLLTGGILAGKSLIRASELRGAATEYQRYLTARHAFKDKYFGLPGDISNATSFWGKDNTNCSSDTGTAATNGTCNGDGDGVFDGALATSTGEKAQFWRQLALAGLIEGTYSGIIGASGTDHMVIGTNVPRSKVSSGGWSVSNYDMRGVANATYFSVDYGNHFVFGASTTNDVTVGSLLTPEESWNIDRKLDDGKPGTGRILSRLACTTAADSFDLTADYLLSNNTVSCHFRLGTFL